jgi:hypothetical protein
MPLALLLHKSLDHLLTPSLLALDSLAQLTCIRRLAVKSVV